MKYMDVIWYKIYSGMLKHMASIRQLKINVLFHIRIKSGVFFCVFYLLFLKTENGALDHAYIEWIETMLLYSTTSDAISSDGSRKML